MKLPYGVYSLTLTLTFQLYLKKRPMTNFCDLWELISKLRADDKSLTRKMFIEGLKFKKCIELYPSLEFDLIMKSFLFAYCVKL